MAVGDLAFYYTLYLCHIRELAMGLDDTDPSPADITLIPEVNEFEGDDDLGEDAIRGLQELLGFTMYTAPLEDIIKSHLGVEYMVYADDTQLYMVINASDKDERISQLENCIRDVKRWMAANKLKLND